MHRTTTLKRRVLLSFFFFWACVTGPSRATAEHACAVRGMAATVHPLGTDAAVKAFSEGGNAVDAAVAAALTLGVVDNHNSGLGGGCFILIRTPDGQIDAIDGRETAPASAARDMYVRHGTARPELSQEGPLAVAVPGALAAYASAITRYGRLPLSQSLMAAAEWAEHGFPIDRVYAETLAESADALYQDQGSRAVFFKSEGAPYAEGETLKQPDLARTYHQIAIHGPGWFYDGQFAAEVDQWMRKHGGILTAADLQQYETRRRDPIVTTYRDFQIVGFPPPSSGGIHVAQILNILEHFDLRSLKEQHPATAYHVIAEAMKLAFADRAHWLGDADFVPVPRGLISKSYGAELAQRIDLTRVNRVDAPGRPPGWESAFFGKHTTHIAAADQEGFWVAITATINTSFGAKVVVPATGVVLNNEMDDFSAQPGAPNAFGLVGAEHNAIAPGKRPLSSMSPTIVLREGRPVMTVGAAGGPMIITQVVSAIVNHLDWQLPLDQALDQSRLHHQWFPDLLLVEQTFPQRMADNLRRMGHEVNVIPAAGVVQAIGISPTTKWFVGVHDPRVPGKAAGL